MCLCGAVAGALEHHVVLHITVPLLLVVVGGARRQCEDSRHAGTANKTAQAEAHKAQPEAGGRACCCTPVPHRRHTAAPSLALPPAYPAPFKHTPPPPTARVFCFVPMTFVEAWLVKRCVGGSCFLPFVHFCHVFVGSTSTSNCFRAGL